MMALYVDTSAYCCPATKQHAGMSATSFAHHMLPSVPNRRITNVCDAGDMLHRSVPVATSDQRMHIMAVGTCLCSKHGGGPHQPLLLTIKPATPAALMHTLSISELCYHMIWLNFVCCPPMTLSKALNCLACC